MQTTQTNTVQVLLIDQWIDGVGVEKHAYTADTASDLSKLANTTAETSVWGRLVEVDTADYDSYNEYQAMANYDITDHALEGRFCKIEKTVEEIENPTKDQLEEIVNLIK
jgi:hypothetical protein